MKIPLLAIGLLVGPAVGRVPRVGRLHGGGHDGYAEFSWT